MDEQKGGPPDLCESEEHKRGTNAHILIVDTHSVRGLLAALICLESKSVELDPTVAYVIMDVPERLETVNRGYAPRTKPFVPETRPSAYRLPRVRRNGLRSQVSPYGRPAQKSGRALRQSAKRSKK